jgi:site-specific DNA-methyltransferase (adenine-specific)
MKGQRAAFSSQSVDWPTPAALYAELNREFHFDLDPCPLGGGIVDGTSPMFCSWDGRRVFCNPPYGPALVPFLERAKEAALAVYLIPARTDTRWFHDLVLPCASEIRFIKGRLKFGDAKNSAPFPSMLVVYRNE